MWDMGIANPSGRQFSTIFTTVLRTPYLFPAEPVVTLRRDKRVLSKQVHLKRKKVGGVHQMKATNFFTHFCIIHLSLN